MKDPNRSIVFVVSVMFLVMASSVAQAGRIAFSTDRNANWDIYKMRDDGTAQVPVADELEAAHNPSIGPGGKKVIYDRQGKLWLQEFAFPGDPIGDPVQLACPFPNSRCEDPNAGRIINFAQDFRIIFTVIANSTGEFTIHMATLDVSEETLIDFVELASPDDVGNPVMAVFEPTWCGDDHFVFTADDQYFGAICRREYDADGPVGDVDCWFAHLQDGMSDRYPSCDPDGMFITWARESAAYGSEVHDIWRMNNDGTNPIPLVESQYDDTMPAWNPGGTKIAFAKNRQIGGPGLDYEIYVYTIVSGTAEPITENTYEDVAPSYGAEAN